MCIQDWPVVDVSIAQKADRLHPQGKHQALEGTFLLVCGHMSHHGQVFHQATSLPFRGVCRAEHSPLAWLQ